MYRYLIGGSLGLLLGFLGTALLMELLWEPPVRTVAVVPTVEEIVADDAEEQTPAPATPRVPDTPTGLTTSQEPPAQTNPHWSRLPETVPAGIEPWVLEAALRARRYERLTGTGWIEGRVTERSGRPIVGVRVEAHAWTDPEERLPRDTPHRQLVGWIESDRWVSTNWLTMETDADGRYRFDNLPEYLQYGVDISSDAYLFQNSRRVWQEDLPITVDFIGQPLVRLRLNAQMPDGSLATEGRIHHATGRSRGHGNEFVPLPYEAADRYEPAIEYWIELPGGLETEHIIVPATDERPIPAIDATLQVRAQAQPGLNLTLHWDERCHYPLLVPTVNVIPIDSSTVVDEATVEALVTMAPGRPTPFQDPWETAIDDEQRRAGSGGARMPTTLNYQDLPEGRAIVAVSLSSPAVSVLIYEVVLLPGSTGGPTNLTLDVPPIPDDAFIELRFVPNADRITAERTRVNLTCVTNRGNRFVSSELCRWEDGRWRMYLGRFPAERPVQEVSCLLPLSQFGYADTPLTIPAAALHSPVIVNLTPAVPFTVVVRNLPEGLRPHDILLRVISQPGGSGPEIQHLRSPEWLVNSLVAGQYYLAVYVHGIDLEPMSFSLVSANQTVEYRLPALYSLTLIFSRPVRDWCMIQQIETDDRLDRFRHENASGREHTFQFLPAGRYQVSAMLSGQFQRMRVNVNGDTRIPFTPEE